MLIKTSKILEANQVCFPCGEKYGNRPFPTHNFSVWGGVCDICGHESNVHGLDGGVTSIRDFGYLHEHENHEEWKDVVGYDGSYKVSTFGRVKSFKNSREKVLVKRKANSIKYYTICLSKDGKVKYYLIHRLVAAAFIPNNNIAKDQVNHKNGNKLDNRVENLEWVTNSENRKHSYNELGLDSPAKGKIGKLNKLSKPIIQYDMNHNFVKEWDSMMDVQRNLHIKASNIRSHILGKFKHAGGYIWEYKL